MIHGRFGKVDAIDIARLFTIAGVIPAPDDKDPIVNDSIRGQECMRLRKGTMFAAIEFAFGGQYWSSLKSLSIRCTLDFVMDPSKMRTLKFGKRSTL